MSFGKRQAPTPEPELAGLSEESQSTAQEATPVPYLAGTQPVAARWLSPIYNQRAVEAPQDRPGKK